MEYSNQAEYEVTGRSEAAAGTALLKMYNAAVKGYKARGREEKKKVAQWARIIEAMESADDRAAFMGQMGEVMIEALSEPPAALIRTPEVPDPLRYDTRNMNDRRRDAIVAYMERTGKATITTQEARHVLQTAENRKLDRKAIWRALRAAQAYLGASLDLLGGVLRLLLPTPSTSSPRRSEGARQPLTTVGGGDTLPRPRAWPVPWDGED